ncbi:hypothetical protein MEQU1_000812 [Malassezia equina]|uniref:Uncharacterized protein n=1 Tax=Malassezia equina TaxID=1381935 RepID=A0AAF0J2N0_9BASI|nr:hypothetical protein MEQU1_000812 [Malassezia equina]
MAHRLAWDYILKFIIIGDASVGKSSLLVRLTEDRFLVHSDTTIGIEFGSHIVTLPKGERLKLQIWDTAGSCLIVYDVTQRETFDHVETWLQDVREQADEHAIIALVGNMADLPSTERRVSTDEGAAWAHEHGAKTGQNVPTVFETVAQHILEQLRTQRQETDRDDRVDLFARTSTSSCCG